MTITIATAMFAYAIDAILVGASFVFAKRRYFPTWSKRSDLAVLILIFAFLEVVWIPAVTELNMSISFGNAAVYGLFGLNNPVDGIDLFGFDMVSALGCLAEALLARAVAYKLSRGDWSAA